MVSQRESTKSNDVEQLTLLPTRKASPPPDLDYLVALPNARRALRYSLSLADLEPKQVYEPLGMDKAVWSRIENGGAGFPAHKIRCLSAVVGNDAFLFWLCHDNGFDIHSMRKVQDDKDRRIAELEAELAKEREEKAIIAKFVRETIR